MSKFTESVVEEAALQWLAELGYATAFGPEIAPEEPGAERENFDQTLLLDRLRTRLRRSASRRALRGRPR